MFMTRLTRCAAAAGILLLAACEGTGSTPGLLGQARIFDFSEASAEDISAALREDGRVVLAGGVLFPTDSDVLSESGQGATAQLAGALEFDQALKVAIVGHTDNTGDFNYNLGLSERRANAMARALVQDHGIASDRLAAVGVGPVAPAASNDTPEGRSQNRRVEVVLIQ